MNNLKINLMNNITYELQDVCSLHNHADDNTICSSHSDMNNLKINLINNITYELQGVCSLHNHADDNTICCSYADLALKWLKSNHRKANPS